MKTNNDMQNWNDKAEHGLSEGQMQAINWLSLNREVAPNGWSAAKEVISASQARFALGLGLGGGDAPLVERGELREISPERAIKGAI